jgi:hypothetical protein
MDKINVTDAALATADATLKNLKDNICATVSKHETVVKDQFDGIDIDLQNALLEYLEELISFKNKVVEFETANSKAIRDRITRISEYSATSYKRRNIT